MRRAVVTFIATVTGLVLLLSFKTAGSRSPARPAALSGAQGTDDGPTPTRSSAASPAPASNGSTTTVTGSSVRVSEGFRTFGSVQVRVTLTNGKIAKVVAVDYPNNDPRSYAISQYSIPVLEQEVLAAQGTHIDAVSGATYTSEAYAQSVQAALDRAKS